MAKKPIITLIAALSENRVIGNQGRIPWHITQDLKRFWDKTKDHSIILGRKTLDSLLHYYQKANKSLPPRTYIIVTTNKDYKVNNSNCFIVHSIKEALQLAKSQESHFAKASRDKEIFIAGGAQIFSQTINLADKLYLTIVKGNFKGDAYFPEYKDFKKVSDSGWQQERKYKFKFLDLEKET